MSTKKKDKYDCNKCPGWCCSYERIPVTSEDIQRLARHLEGEIEDVREHCLDKHGDYLYLRHKKDTIFKSTCVFFDRVARRCGVYEARPWVCRKYPWSKRCGYYDFIKFEREMMEDDEFIPFPYPK